MWRSFFLAVGIMLIILGLECLMIDSATVYAAGDANASDFIDPRAVPAGKRILQPAEWMPWTLLSTGAIVVLYAITLPRRWGGGGGE